MSHLIEGRSLVKYYKVSSGIFGSKIFIKAVDDIDITIEKSQVVALIGESGSGKSTLAKMLVGLLKPDKGRVLYKGRDLYSLRGREAIEARHSIQMIFQNPDSSLNPRMSVLDILSEAILENDNSLSKEGVINKAIELIEKVRLSPDHLIKYPHELSGGEKQRIAIARAIAMEPEFIVADEPVSALDVSVRAQIINLLLDIQRETRVSMLFIAHDFRTVWNISDVVIVMYLGKILEYGPTEEIFKNPRHPYTRILLSTSPMLPKELGEYNLMPTGEPPSLVNPPKGCRFHTRCPFAKKECREINIGLVEVNRGHFTACPFHNMLF